MADLALAADFLAAEAAFLADFEAVLAALASFLVTAAFLDADAAFLAEIEAFFDAFLATDLAFDAFLAREAAFFDAAAF